MGYPDIERARAGQAALARVVESYAGDAADLRALRRMVDLCRDLSDAIDDDYCQQKVRMLAEFCAELFSQPKRRADFLRQQIHAALELLQSRLYRLERDRRFGQIATQKLGAALAPR